MTDDVAIISSQKQGLISQRQKGIDVLMEAKLSAVALDPPIVSKVASSLVWAQTQSTEQRAMIDAFGVKNTLLVATET